MPVEIRRFGDAGKKQEHKRIFLWGDSGGGKTAAIVRADADLDVDLAEVLAGRADPPVGDPGIFLLTHESNGLDTARFVNPAVGWVLAEARPEGESQETKAIDATKEVIRMAMTGELGRLGFHTLVIDGLTEFQRLVKDDIVGDLGRDRANWFSQDDWGYLNERMRLALRLIRALPLHVVCTALEVTRENERTKVVEVMPAFEGRKMHGEVMQYFSAAGRMTRWLRQTEAGDEVEDYAARFSAEARFKVKSCVALRGVVKPCAASWIRVLQGERDAATIVHPQARVVRAAAETPVTTTASTAETTTKAARPRRAS